MYKYTYMHDVFLLFIVFLSINMLSIILRSSSLPFLLQSLKRLQQMEARPGPLKPHIL